MSTKKRGLGRGLEALLGAGSKAAAAITQEVTAEERDGLREIAIQHMQPGKYQPRTGMDPARLTELADSIRVQGVIQPIVVRELGKNKFEIIAGERRWRAAQQAGLEKVPVVVREVDDRAVIAMALIENIQREDLNPLEEAVAIQRLIDEFALTHQQAAEAVGRSRAAVSNLLRLLELPAGIRALVEQKQLEMGHARALLTLAPAAATALAKEAAEQGWSVREVERRAQLIAQGKVVTAKPGAKPVKKSDADIQALENELSERLATKVSIQHGRGGRGKLVINYTSLETLDGVLEKIRGQV
jgi:ParB family transcriptional regulator, chromosome partitioning protein